MVVREDATGLWREHVQPTTLGPAREILGLLRSLGLPDHSPDVEAVTDTSDVWTHLVLHVTVNDRSGTFDLPMAASGFKERGAGLLRILLRSLALLA